MNSFMFGDGKIVVDFSSVEGRPGLLPCLRIKGKLVADDFGLGSLLQITANVSAWNIVGTYAFLGTTFPSHYVLNYLSSDPQVSNPPPPNQRRYNIELDLPLIPSIIEGLEQRRQGREFQLQLDVDYLLLDRGQPLSSNPPQSFFGTHPKISDQQRLQITPSEWAQVLERWEMGASVHVLVPLPELDPNPDRAQIVRLLKEARQKIDGGDYEGSLSNARKALELLRTLLASALPLPSTAKNRDMSQRTYVVVDSLFQLASASQHVDGATRHYSPIRADAVAVVGATASLAQQVFVQLNRD